MGAPYRPLVIGDPHFAVEDLAGLKKQSAYFSNARVVHSLAELLTVLGQERFSFVVQLCRAANDIPSPEGALKIIKAQLLPVPYIAVGAGLTATTARHLIDAGAKDCISREDQRDVDQVIRRVCAPIDAKPNISLQETPVLDDQRLFDVLAEGLVLIDPDLRIQAVNPALQNLTGYGNSDLKDTSVFALDAGGLTRHLRESQKTAVEWRGEVKIRRQDGSVFPAWAVMSSVAADDTNTGGIALLLSDISEQIDREQRIRRQASFDVLTGLPNRALLQDRMDQVLATAKRKKTGAAILFVDLDHFKEANDTWGHGVGDEILTEAAKRLQSCIRQSDTVARIGGDEFVVVLTDMNEDHLAEKVASKIAGAIERPFVLCGAGIYLSASIGIALYPIHGETAETLFANADAAMYEVKRNGRRGYRLFGDLAAISHTAAATGRPDVAKAASGVKPTVFNRLAEFLARDITISAKSLLPVGAAAASIVVIFAWLFASGMVGFMAGPTDELYSESELNDFGTAAGSEDGPDQLESFGAGSN